MTFRYDWSRVDLFGFETQADAAAFARRVEEIADEEAARNASTLPAPPEPQEAS